MKTILVLLLAVASSHQFAFSEPDSYGPDVPERPLDSEEQQFEHYQLNLLPEIYTRSKRSSKYKILESPGLHSHFQVVQDEEVLKANPHRRRNRRSVESRSELHSDEVEDVDTDTRKYSSTDDISVEDVPQAEKQTMNPAYYRSDDSRLMDKWVKAPYGDFQQRAKEDDDAQSEASSNVGIKTRTPRVNFITQQGQSSNNKDEPDGPEARERERERDRERERERDRDQPGNNKQQSADDGYSKPANERYNPPSYGNKNYDPYEQPPRYNTRPYYDPYGPAPQYYGRNPYRDSYYYPYRDRELSYSDRPPAGMSRMTPPIGPSSSFYYRHQYNDYDEYLPRSIPGYYYSDKRFDLPMEPRDPYERELYRPYLYTNEVNNRPGRIIYYANLPEIVRTPNNYRSATARYGDPMPNNYYYNDDYRGVRTAKSAPLPATTTMRISSSPVRADTARERSYYG